MSRALLVPTDSCINARSALAPSTPPVPFPLPLLCRAPDASPLCSHAPHSVRHSPLTVSSVFSGEWLFACCAWRAGGRGGWVSLRTVWVACAPSVVGVWCPAPPSPSSSVLGSASAYRRAVCSQSGLAPAICRMVSCSACVPSAFSHRVSRFLWLCEHTVSSDGSDLRGAPNNHHPQLPPRSGFRTHVGSRRHVRRGSRSVPLLLC